MAASNSQVPDLASVLKTLASLAPQSQQQGINHSQNSGQAAQQWPSPQVQRNSIRAEAGIKPRVVDPATIIDWSSGLKCVMKTVASHENIIKEIRRMIAVQHEHEEQWWNGRQALLKKQKDREQGQKELDEVLKAIGGVVGVKQKPEEAAEELKAFDVKVHRAQEQMVAEMTSRLKSLGVPFFGTRKELIVSSDDLSFDGSHDQRINEKQLLGLQRRMIEILEDLCAE